MRKLYFGLFAAAVGLASAGRSSAQNPIAVPVPNALPPAVAAQPPQPPATPPMAPAAPGAYGALHEIAGCPCPAAEAPPAPPPFGGPLHERPKLLGDWGGHRTRLRDHGITIDAYSTNFYAGVASGGLQEQFRYRGRGDVVLNVDGEKAGLMKGSFITLHAESVFGDSINNRTGSLLPTVLAQAVPTPSGSAAALTGVKYTQALSEKFVLFGGKLNILDEFNQPFTGGARGVDGFMNTGMLFNPIYARTIPYSTYGAGAAILKDLQPVVTLLVLDATNTPTRDGFDTFFRNGTVIVPAINIPTKFFGLPGHQGISGSYSSRTYAQLDRSTFINTVVLNQPVSTRTGSWSLAYNFDQAVHVDPENAKRSWGLFGNLGLADQDVSPFRWFANVGVGGSSPLACRKLDTFGIGYYYLGLNDGFRNIAPRLLPLRDEQAVEVFYNFAVTPWCRVTPDLQVIFPAQKRADTALFLGLRAKIDF
jgi:porin